MYLRTVTFPWLVELKLKDFSHLMGYIGAKLAKVLLRHFVGEPMIELSFNNPEQTYAVARGSTQIRQKLFQAIEMLTEASSFDCFQ
jgi:hypothetical protein